MSLPGLTTGNPKLSVSLIAEGIFLFLIIAGLLYTFFFTVINGYLPQPYFYGSESLFTDWTVTAYFAHQPGTYSSFQSVYPPLSFVFLRYFSIKACYEYDDIFASRDCDWMVPVTLVTFFIINIYVAYKVYANIDRRTALMRALVIGLGLPSLYALERGNLIIPCFTFFMLGNSRVLRSVRLKWICSAIAINFKPYLIMTLLAPLIKRRWRWFEGAAVTGLLVYIATFIMNGDGNPVQVVSNIMAFTTSDAHGLFNRAVYASSYRPIVELLDSNFPLMNFLGSKPIDLMDWLLPALVTAGKVGPIVCFGAALLKPNVIPVFRLCALAIAYVLVSQDPGGYSVVFFFFFVLMEEWRGVFTIAALVLTYLLSISADIKLLSIAHELVFSYLTKREVGYDLGLNLGEIIRPAMILGVEYALIGASFTDFFRKLEFGGTVAISPGTKLA